MAPGARPSLRPRALRLVQGAAVLLALMFGLEAALEGLGWIDAQVREWLPAGGFLADCVSLYLHIVVLALVLMVLEWWRPGSGAPRRYGAAALFWTMYVPVAVISADVADVAARALQLQPLLDVHARDFAVDGAVELLLHAALILAGAACFDFFYYWFHRLQHAVPLLWAFHSTHHANRSLNALGCYHHPLEDLWRIPLFTLPMAMAFEIVAPELFLLSAFVVGWGLFNHADTSFHLGRPLRHVLADNHYHRIHHALASEYHGANFAGMFSLWDRLFGTQRMPEAGAAALPVGLDDQPHPETVGQFLLGPWQVLAPPHGEAQLASRRSRD